MEFRMVRRIVIDFHAHVTDTNCYVKYIRGEKL